MIPLPPRSTRTHTLFPYTSLFRSGNRMPTRPLSALAQDYPGTDPAKFASPNGIDPQHVSLVGFVIDGVHYSGGCTTRRGAYRSEEHTSELQSLMRISYAVFCLKKKKQHYE